jgi:LysM repeat protein
MHPCTPGTHAYTVRAGDTLWAVAQRFRTDINAIARLNPGISPDALYIGQSLCIPETPIHQSGMAVSKSGLNQYLRMLWEQHVYWTRLFIVSTVFSLPDAKPVTDRLLRNPKDFAAALQPIYGAEVAGQFSTLLTDHLSIAAQLVKAAMSGDSGSAATLEKQWYANADSIAAFLAQINPYWSEQTWRRMLHEHLRMTKDEAVYYITGKYADSVTVFDAIEKEALEMADEMARGIALQFPGSFVD